MIQEIKMRKRQSHKILKKRKKKMDNMKWQQHPFLVPPPNQRSPPLKNNSTQKGKYNLYVQPINLIQKRGLGQTRSECEETGKGASRK